VEQKALAHAAAFPSAMTALNFLIEWPALEARTTGAVEKARREDSSEMPAAKAFIPMTTRPIYPLRERSMISLPKLS